jgi:capsular polysaccharide biosynthesis protein
VIRRRRAVESPGRVADNLRSLAVERGWSVRDGAPAVVELRPPSRLLAEDVDRLYREVDRFTRKHVQTILSGERSRGRMYFTHLLAATRYPVPETFVCTVPDAFVHVPLGGVFSSDGIALAQSAMRGVLETVPPPDAPISTLEGAVVPLLGWGAEQNYGHWLIDVLPRLALLGDTKDTAFAVVDPTPPWQAAALELLGVAGDRICPLAEGWHRVEQAVVCVAAERSTVPHRRHLLDLRERLLGAAGAGSESLTRLFVSRARSRRPLANEDELLPVLEERGFEVVYPEELSFAEQIRLFARAEAVAGLNGTGMLNELFCPPGTAIVELLHPHYWHHDACRLAALLGHVHWSAFAEDAGNLASRIDPGKVGRILDYALGTGSAVDDPF